MKTSFTGSVVAFMLLLAALGGYVALRTMVGQKSVAVLLLNQEVTAKTNEAAKLAAVKEQLTALAGVEERVQAYFVPNAAVVSFINELQSRGETLGTSVEINSVAAVPATKNNRPILKISLLVNGPFDAVVRTLGSIEYAPYALSATSFTLTADPDKKKWSATVNLLVVATDLPGAAITAPVTTTTAPVQAPPTKTAATTTTTTPTKNTKIKKPI